MGKENSTIPFQAARLIIQYLHNSLTEQQKDELDDWVNASDENMHMFGDLTEGVDNNVFDPNDLLIETEEAVDLWIIAALIVRSQQGLNDVVEEKHLKEWIDAFPRNKEIYNELLKPAVMQKMLVWSRLKQAAINN